MGYIRTPKKASNIASDKSLLVFVSVAILAQLVYKHSFKLVYSMLSVVYFFLLCIMAPKRRSWHGLVGTHGISDTALAAVLTHCKKTPVEKNCGTHRRTIYRAIEDSYSKVASKIQLPLKDGTVWDWHIARLDKMLEILCAESSKFRFVISMALKHASDGSVLEMISYLDEVIPGNALKPDNGRKTWAIYITCRDLPQWMLQI